MRLCDKCKAVFKAGPPANCGCGGNIWTMTDDESLWILHKKLNKILTLLAPKDIKPLKIEPLPGKQTIKTMEISLKPARTKAPQSDTLILEKKPKRWGRKAKSVRYAHAAQNPPPSGPPRRKPKQPGWNYRENMGASATHPSEPCPRPEDVPRRRARKHDPTKGSDDDVR